MRRLQALQVIPKNLHFFPRILRLTFDQKRFQPPYTFALFRQTLFQVEAERAVWSGTAESARITRDAAERRLHDWADAERIRGVLNDDDRLVASFRMYVSGGLEPVPSWLVGDLVPILGAGVSSVVLDMVRKAEQDPALDPYYDALEAEIAIQRGQRQAALKLAEQALDTLPEFEALLRARVAAIAGEAAWALGQDRVALEFLATAMQRDAGVIRRRALALPAKLESDASGPVAKRVVELLEDSPRFDFDYDGSGFTITLQGSGRQLELCLLEPAGGVLGCASTPPEPEPDKPRAGQAVADEDVVDDDDYAS